MRKLDRDKETPPECSLDTPTSPTQMHILVSVEKYSRQGDDTKIQPVPRISQVSELI